MSIDINKAFEVSGNGLAITDSNDNVLLYLTSGTGSPVGQQAPVPTLYVDETGSIWKKIGATVNDWEEIQTAAGDNNIDGGFSLSTYLPDQCFDGGGA